MRRHWIFISCVRWTRETRWRMQLLETALAKRDARYLTPLCHDGPTGFANMFWGSWKRRFQIIICFCWFSFLWLPNSATSDFASSETWHETILTHGHPGLGPDIPSYACHNYAKGCLFTPTPTCYATTTANVVWRP